MSRQDNSDPLPYVQVDRAVKPKATLLANALGVSTQHALGSLVEWWELCGDPRELETIVAATAPGEEPAVVLEGSDAALRFKLASGRDVEPVVLVRLGLLEPQQGRFRVRGMSRYFEPIERRIQAREAASKGGIASAASRKRSGGTAQPEGGKGFGARSDGGSDSAQATAQAEPKREPKRNGSDDRSGTEAEPNPSGQRSTVSDQLPLKEAPPPPKTHVAIVYEKPDKPTDVWGADEFFAWAQWKRQEAGFVGERTRPRTLSSWFSEAMMVLGGNVEPLMEAFYVFGEQPHWQRASPPLPFQAFISQWDRFVPRGAARAVNSEA